MARHWRTHPPPPTRTLGTPLPELRIFGAHLIEIELQHRPVRCRPPARTERFQLLHQVPMALALQECAVLWVVAPLGVEPKIVRELAIVRKPAHCRRAVDTDPVAVSSVPA